MENVIKVLKECEALLEGHFLLSSGKHSNKYVQCAKVLRFPDKAAIALAPAVQKLIDQNIEIDILVGPAMGGIVVAYEVGRQLGIEAIFAERVDNVMEIRRGFEIKKGAKVLITEDVVTTGKSTIEAKKAIEAIGGVVVGVACIVDRRAPGVEIDMPIFSSVKLEIETYESDGCPLCADGSAPIKPGSRKF